MLKKEARSTYRTLRNASTPQQRMKWDDLMLIRFQTLDLPFVHAIMSFYPSDEKGEVNSFLFSEYLLFKNPSMQIAYPRINDEHHTMQAVLCGADTVFEQNRYGIPEPLHGEVIPPSELNLVLIPMLVCDEQGHRVGYGKGYYDRFLSLCSDDCIKVGLSWFEPVPMIEDTEVFDVPLDLCITPQKVYVF
jgi:5-formyltetrahydrofolate cyclo-ligase